MRRSYVMWQDWVAPLLVLGFVSGDGSVAPYASVIDNLSSGGFFIGSQFAPNAPFASGASTFRVLFDQMRSAQ